MRRRLPFGLLLWLAASGAAADVFRPAYLELR